jgi:hypothetical protein
MIQNPNQNQPTNTNHKKTSPMPKYIYCKLNTYPIQQILDIKNTTRKDSYQIHKIENK